MNTTLISNLRALPRPVWIHLFGSFINKFGTFVVPFLALYLTRQGFTVAHAGIAIGAYGLGNLSASLLGGHLADTLERRKTIVLSMFSAAIAMMLLSQAQSFPTIVLLTALAGLTGELYRPAGSALLADLVAPEQRLTAYAAYRMAFNAGFAFGPAIAGLLAERGFFWLFIGDAATSVLFGIVALFALPRGVRSKRNETDWTEATRHMLKDRKFQRMVLAAGLIGLIFVQISSTFSVHVTRLGFSAGTYGALVSLNGLLVVLCELPLTTLTRRFPARPMIAAGYLLIGIGFALNAFANTVPLLAACMLILTFGEMIAMSVAATYVANLAPADMRGRYMGVYGLTWAVGLTIAPAIGMKLFAINPMLLWITGGALGLLAATIVTREPTLKTVSPWMIPKVRNTEALLWKK